VKLRRVVIKDFRPFYGTQELSFSHGKNRNVTVVHAENGLGKTALLNALLWALYGKDGLTEDVEQPDRIVNEVTAANGKDSPADTHAEVIVFFDHDDDEFILRRKLTLANQMADASKTELRLEFTRGGQTYTEKGTPTEVQNRISSILPPGISPYLFFNGERMNYLGSSGNQGDIKNAIHQMLGLNLLQRTIDDLESQSVAGRFKKELREDADDNMQRLLDELEKIEKQRDSAKSAIANGEKEVAALENDIEKISAKLEANRDVQELQKERRALEDEVKKLDVLIAEAEKGLRRLISEEAMFLFTEDLVREGRAITSRLRSEGRIPARVLKDFIQDLLNAEECICKRSLKRDSPEFQAVLAQLEASPDASFNEAVSSLDNALGAMDGKAEDARRHLKDAHVNYEQLRDTHRLKVARIKEISETIGDKDDEEIRDLESKREAARMKIRQHDSEKGRAQERIDQANKAIADLNQKIDACKQQVGKADLARKRLSMTENVAGLLRKMLEAETQRFLVVLRQEIRTNFSKINFKGDWQAYLTSDFRLEIQKKVGGEVMEAAKSTGENQIAAFAFIGSLVALAKRLGDEAPIMKGVQGGEFPLVMDSPFGALGEAFRDAVARMLPDLAPQVVVFVSPTQWKGEVERNLAPRTDKRYLLQYHGPNPPENLAEDVELGGSVVPQIVQAEHEMTQIVEVS
jgi:DNA sulfur modification protein DndD